MKKCKIIDIENLSYDDNGLKPLYVGEICEIIKFDDYNDMVLLKSSNNQEHQIFSDRISIIKSN